MKYPTRPQFFAHRFIRLMMKAVAAQEVGPDGFCLLAAIAMTEDAKRYRGPVVFFNQPLMAVCGFTSEKVFFRVRQRCVDTGWLVWNHGKKGVAATYWVAIPDQCECIEDGPVDEVASEIDSLRGLIPESYGEELGTNREVIGNQLGTNRESIGGTFIPVPIPVPKSLSLEGGKPPRKQFEPPTVQEVREHCEGRGNTIDAELFVNHYQARGWKLNGGQPMKDWKAAVVTWERRNQATTETKPKSRVPTLEDLANYNPYATD